MKFIHSKETFEIIYDAYYAGLSVSWYVEGDYYRYTLTQSMLYIDRKKTTYEYERAVSYNVDQVFIQPETGDQSRPAPGSLVIITPKLTPDFIFPPCEEEEEGGE